MVTQAWLKLSQVNTALGLNFSFCKQSYTMYYTSMSNLNFFFLYTSNEIVSSFFPFFFSLRIMLWQKSKVNSGKTITKLSCPIVFFNIWKYCSHTYSLCQNTRVSRAPIGLWWFIISNNSAFLAVARARLCLRPVHIHIGINGAAAHAAVNSWGCLTCFSLQNFWISSVSGSYGMQ